MGEDYNREGGREYPGVLSTEVHHFIMHPPDAEKGEEINVSFIDRIFPKTDLSLLTIGELEENIRIYAGLEKDIKESNES